MSLYVHIPWCERKCPYCDFNSHRRGPNLPEADYLRALIADLDADRPLVKGRRLESIFIGGGTPSLIAAESIAELLAAVSARLPRPVDIEVTLEANPGTLDRQKLVDLRGAGVTRLSIGAQSFNDAALARLGRIHDSAQARRTVEFARNAGFESINIDLMYGLPSQTLEEARHDLRCAVELDPDHISHYQLTLEPGTVFYLNPPPLPEDDLAWRMQTQCQSLLADSGYQHYEVSAFARRGKECRHNLNYWRFGDYLGIGAGAHGKVTDAETGRIMRTRKRSSPDGYIRAALSQQAIEKLQLRSTNVVASKDLVLEFMMNALRLRDGFSRELFEARTGLPLRRAAGGLDAAQARGLIARGDGRIRPSERGWRYLNDLVSLFVPDPAAP